LFLLARRKVEAALNTRQRRTSTALTGAFDWRYRVSERGAGQVTTAPWLTTASDRT
jgi:hypothetical protein